MESWLLVVLTVLAVHRITRLIIVDRITRRPVEAVQRRFELRRERQLGYRSEEEWLSGVAYLLGCRWCLSIWVGAAVVAAVDLTVGLPVPVLVWLAASSLTGILPDGSE